MFIMRKKFYGSFIYYYFIFFPIIYVLNAYGDYAHAKKSVTVSASIDFGFNGLPSVGISFSPSIVSSYDSMNTAQAYWEGLNW